MMCQNFNGRFNNRIKFKFNQKIYIKIMRCKIVRFQKLIQRNMMRLTKNKKTSILRYSINIMVRTFVFLFPRTQLIANFSFREKSYGVSLKYGEKNTNTNHHENKRKNTKQGPKLGRGNINLMTCYEPLALWSQSF